MASLVLSGDTSGSITVSAPAVAGSTTQTLVNVTGTLAPIVSGTAVTASGTSVEFTGIPSWVKRITVMFIGVSTNGTSQPLIQIGSGSFSTSGYLSTSVNVSNAAVSAGANRTDGFVIVSATAAAVMSGQFVITTLGSNIWTGSHMLKQSTTNCIFGSGDITLGGTLDRIRITTVNGTDTFDAGTINIIYE